MSIAGTLPLLSRALSSAIAAFPTLAAAIAPLTSGAFHAFRPPEPVFALWTAKPVFTQRSAMSLSAFLATPQCRATPAPAAAIARPHACHSPIYARIVRSDFLHVADAFFQGNVRLVAAALPAHSRGTRLFSLPRAAALLDSLPGLLTGRIGALAVDPDPTGTAHPA